MSMYINFFTQKRGERMNQLVAGRFDYVPRMGETVSMDNRTRDVLSVDYDLTKNSLDIILSD